MVEGLGDHLVRMVDGVCDGVEVRQWFIIFTLWVKKFGR